MSLVDAILENSRKAKQCPCPHCGRKIDDSCELGELGLVTYWAEGGTVEVECGSCSKAFYVREWVTREYSVGRTEDEADNFDVQEHKR